MTVFLCRRYFVFGQRNVVEVWLEGPLLYSTLFCNAVTYVAKKPHNAVEREGAASVNEMSEA